MIELGLVDLRAEDDVVRAHQTTRTIAAQLGFSTFEQTRIATAMSEIARNAPYTTPVRRLDEAAAARKPIVRQAM